MKKSSPKRKLEQALKYLRGKVHLPDLESMLEDVLREYDDSPMIVDWDKIRAKERKIQGFSA